MAPKEERPSYDAAARLFTGRYATSRLASWNVRAVAAGDDCAVLRIHIGMIVEKTMVESMHFGEGAYDVYEGGVRQFAAERQFRGIAYIDQTGMVWKYGNAEGWRERCGV